MSSHPYPASQLFTVPAVPTRDATWGQTRSEFRTKSDPVASGFFDVAGFEADLGAVDFAIDLVISVDEADVLGLGAALERAGAATQFEILNEYDRIAIGEDGTVGIFDDARAFFGRSALPYFGGRLLPFMSAGCAFPNLCVRDDFGHRAFGARGRQRGHQVRVWSIEYGV